MRPGRRTQESIVYYLERWFLARCARTRYNNDRSDNNQIAAGPDCRAYSPS